MPLNKMAKLTTPLLQSRPGPTPHCATSVPRSSSFRLPMWPKCGPNRARLGRYQARFRRAQDNVGSAWPRPGQTWSQSSQTWLFSNQRRSMPSQFESLFVKSGPSLVPLGPNLADFEPMGPIPDQVWSGRVQAKFGRFRAKVGQFSGQMLPGECGPKFEVCPNSFEIVSSLVECGHRWADFSQRRPNPGRFRGKSALMRLKLSDAGRIWPDLGKTPPMLQEFAKPSFQNANCATQRMHTGPDLARTQARVCLARGDWQDPIQSV